MQFGYSRNGIPTITKNLIIINVLMFLGAVVLQGRGYDGLNNLLGMHYFRSDLFEPWQLVTHMFMHGGIWHLFFNMFMLYMFGRNLEMIWGPKRFFNFYFLTAFGAMLLYYIVVHFQVMALDPVLVEEVIATGGDGLFSDRTISAAYLIHGPTVGASGAIMGLLGATYVLFPNTTVYLYFAIPIKMKWLTLGIAAYEIYRGVTMPGDNVAHAAHIGGLLAGILIVKYWNKTKTNSFY